MSVGVQQTANPDDLVAALKALAPAANPQTPNIREDVEHEAIERLHAIRIDIERAREKELDPLKGRIFSIMHGTIEQMLQGYDAMTVLNYLQGIVSPPQPPAPMMQPPMPQPGAPPQGGPPMGAPMPPQGGPPPPMAA